MKCPIDQTEMEKGYLTEGVWIQGEQSVLTKPLPWAKSYAKQVTAWKCPKCGKVELKIEENK